MFVIALRHWISSDSKGNITIIGDASGDIRDLVAMRAKSTIVNCLVKQAAVHLAPLGLDLLGVHVWAEHNTAADELSRAAQRDRQQPGEILERIPLMAAERAEPAAPEPALWRHCEH